MTTEFERWKKNFLHYLNRFSLEFSNELLSKHSNVPLDVVGVALIYQSMQQKINFMGESEADVINQSLDVIKSMCATNSELYSICKTQLILLRGNTDTEVIDRPKMMNEVTTSLLNITACIELEGLDYIDAFAAWFAFGVSCLTIEEGGEFIEYETGISELISNMFSEIQTVQQPANDHIYRHPAGNS